MTRTSVSPRLFLPIALAAVCAIPTIARAQDTGLKDDDLNGLWKATLGGKVQKEDVLTEAWPSIGARIRVNGCVTKLVRKKDDLTSAEALGFDDVLANLCGDTTPPKAVALKIDAGDLKRADDDTLTGKYFGKSLVLKRDTDDKPPIVIRLPGDRPWMLFQTQILDPAANRDRESYFTMRSTEVDAFLSKCELYDYWQRKYMKGGVAGSKVATAEQHKNFEKIITACEGIHSTPRALIREAKFADAVKANLADPTQVGLALSNFTLYFAAAAGRGVRILVTDDSKVYFLTDRPSRAEKIGVCAMWTPTHGPLASTFGRLLLDLGKMPETDDKSFWKCLIEVLAKSDSKTATKLSGLGKSAMTDYVGVMGIEHYRDIAFQNPEEQWGYNMTNVLFCSRIARALKQVIVDEGGGPTLNPGEPSYFDVLNNGSDMQELGGMGKLKQLTTAWLREKHPDLVTRVEKSLAKVLPKADLTSLSKNDIFHFLCQSFYDPRIVAIQGAPADEVVDAATALLDVIGTESTSLETYILAHGVKKSTKPAPKATGF